MSPIEKVQYNPGQVLLDRLNRTWLVCDVIVKRSKVYKNEVRTIILQFSETGEVTEVSEKRLQQNWRLLQTPDMLNEIIRLENCLKLKMEDPS